MSINEVAQSIKASEDPLLPLSLLADAAWQLRTLRLRESLLLMGTSCEVAGHLYLRAKDPSGSGDIDQISPKHASFAKRWFHYIPNHFQSRSFGDSAPDKLELVEKMYWSRNNVAHEGRAYYVASSDNSEVQVTQRIATEFLSASQDAIDWLLEIQRYAPDSDA